MKPDDENLLKKQEKLKEILLSYKKVLIAFSGGVDSTYLLKMAFDTLGNNAIAVTANSETYAKNELNSAKNLAEIIGIKHIIVDSNELTVTNFKENPIDRCYYCKKELFTQLKELAKKLDIENVLEGSNIDDFNDYRPGRKAIDELGIKSPLVEADLNKEEIRELSKLLGLSTFNKPAMACLASRFPYGEEITSGKLHKVEKAEQFINSLYENACPLQLRVRYFGETAVVEVDSNLINKFKNDKEIIENGLKAIGFEHTIIDEKGYRMGSLNEELFVNN